MTDSGKIKYCQFYPKSQTEKQFIIYIYNEEFDPGSG